MRNFGAVQTRFWENSTIQQLSDQAKLLATYLLTGPHTNMLGCFRLPNGYITEDLKWNSKIVKKALFDLNQIRFATRDEKSGWLLVHEFLLTNPIQNPKQGICIEKLFNLIPDQCLIWNLTIKSLITYGKYLNEGFSNRLLTLSNCAITDKEQNKDQNKDREQDKYVFLSGEPDVVHQGLSVSKNNEDYFFKSQAIEILNFLNEKTCKAFRDSDTNLKLIMGRLRSGATLMDCRQIIVRKTRDWKGDLKMEKYLRPATLFNSEKFEQYLGELVIPTEDASDGIT